MFGQRLPRSGLLGVLAVALAGVAAGAVLAARFDVLGDPASLDRALQDGELTKVADVPSATGAARRAVYVQRSGGLFCVWDAPSARALTRQGGCNPESDPFGDGELFVSFSYDGGPDPVDVSDARLVGVASEAVASTEVVMSDGAVLELALRPARAADLGLRAFAYRIGKADLRRGVGPVVVRALDAAGDEIDREQTGFNR